MERITSDHPNSGSADLVQENIEQLKQLFPEVIKEGKVDFEALHDLLGNYGDTAEERFCLNWAGKANARREAQKRSTGTLRPCPEESVDWDNTENLYIEGDNLEVLKLLQKGYHGKVKMIYIDPPYNTGKDFVYKDNYADNMANYLEMTGQDKKLSTNTDTDGRYHSHWLNMMYPRLKVARNLLSNDGSILINIDEHEVANLQALLNEIFGEDNSLGTIVWDKRNPKGDSNGISSQHEYILIYAKSRDDYFFTSTIERPKKNADKIIAKGKELIEQNGNDGDLSAIHKEFRNWIKKQTEFSGGERAYNKIDANGDVYRLVSMAWPNKKQAPDDYFIPLIHPETNLPCAIPNRGWRNPPSTMKRLMGDGLIVFGKDHTIQPQRKYLLKENLNENLPSLLYYGGSDTELLTKLEIPFETPKVVEVCMEHISAFTFEDSIVLDFFSGSSTLAHAVMALNQQDNSKRKYICVQLPEQTPEKSEAKKKGYDTITEIGKERIRRSGNIIREESLSESKPDTGFKVFKLDSSNLNAWDSDPANIEKALMGSLFNVKEERSEDDLLYEILLKYGIELTTKVSRHQVAGKTVYEMGAGSLIICLANNLTTEVAEGIGELWKEVRPDSDAVECKVVFKDDGFNHQDDLKANAMLILKRHGIQNIATI